MVERSDHTPVDPSLTGSPSGLNLSPESRPPKSIASWAVGSHIHTHSSISPNLGDGLEWSHPGIAPTLVLAPLSRSYHSTLVPSSKLDINIPDIKHQN